MEDKDEMALALIDECYVNINEGTTNNFASYDEGVRDALLWLLEDGPKPYVGRDL